MIQFYCISIEAFLFLHFLGYGSWRIVSHYIDVDSKLSSTIPALIGAALVIGIGSLLFPRGYSTKDNIVVLFAIGVSSFIISHFIYRFRFQLPRFSLVFFRKSLTHPFTLVLALTSALETFEKISFGRSTLWSVRLGIDGALYVDGAQALINKENIPDFSHINQLHPGSLATSLFEVSHRWGTSFLLATIKTLTNSKHSLSVVIPTLSLLVVTLGVFSYSVIKGRTKSNFLVILIFPLVITNTFLFHLLLEAQWANLIAVVFLFPLFYLFTEALKVSTQRRSIRKTLGLSLICSVFLSAILLTYSEIIPLLMLALFTITSINMFLIRRRERFFLHNWLALLFSLFLTIIFLMPNESMLLPYFGTLFTVNSQKIGYPLPHPIFPSDLLGISSPWHPTTAWNFPEASVRFVSNSRHIFVTLSSILIVFLLMSLIWRMFRHNLKMRFRSRETGWNNPDLDSVSALFFTMVLGFIGSYLYFGFLKYSIYLLMKALSVFMIPLIVYSLLYFLRYFRLTKFSSWATFMVSVYFIVGTFATYASDFSNTSRPLDSSLLTLADWDSLNADNSCILSFGMRGLRDSRDRYFDRTYDYMEAVIFRNHIAIDPWTNQPLIGAIDPKVFGNSNTCAVINKQWDPQSLNNVLREGKRILFETSDWVIVDLNAPISSHTNGVPFEVWQNAHYE